MNFKQKWINALRSGEFKQTDGVLRDEGDEPHHCCLGVGCITLGLKPSVDGNFQDASATGKWDGIVFPTPKQLKSMGISMGGAKKLAGMNDDGCTFEEIATHIERYYAK
jgi:hypothetical protein